MNKKNAFDYFTYSEIKTQYSAWQQALSIIEQNKHALLSFFSESFDKIIFTGCGSTYYLSLAAASLFQQLTGISCIGVPASELLFFPQSIYIPNDNYLLIAISRSGETTETLMAVEEFLIKRKGKVISITNYGDKPLATMGELNFVITEGQELGIVETRAFTSLYVFTVALATIIGKRDDLLSKMWLLPEAGKELISKYELFAKTIGEDLSIERFFFLGSGPRFGLACESDLKMKEMTLTHSEHFHFYEFRHGPMSMVKNSSFITAFISQSQHQNEDRVVMEMKNIGARTLTISQINADILLLASIPEEITNVLYLPIVHLMAYYRALAKKLNPDIPTNLVRVVKIGNN